MNYNDLKKGIQHNTIEQTNDKTSLATTINPTSPMTKINLSMNHATGFNSADIVPVYHTELLPNDTIDMSIDSLIRGSMPRVSTWEVSLMEVTAFFVPNRYIWPDFVYFMGEIKDLGNPNLSPKSVPVIDTITCKFEGSETYSWPREGDLAAYLGIPVGCVQIKSTVASGPSQSIYKVKEPINTLPIQGYFKIYNDWYRAEYFQDPVQFPAGIVNNASGPNLKLILEGDTVQNKSPWTPSKVLQGTGCMRSCKLDDLFTLSLPFVRVGGDVPLGVLDLSKLQLKSIPIIQDPEAQFGVTLNAKTQDGAPARDSWVGTNGLGSLSVFTGSSSPTGTPRDLYFKLATDETVNPFLNPTGAEVVSVNELRQAIAIQHFEEINARSGTKYIEFLRGHFGVQNPAVNFGMSEVVASYTIDLATQNVIQTSSTVTNSPLGTVGGISMNSGHVPKFSYVAKEHGQFYIMITVRPVMNYPYGLPKKFSKIEKLDYYVPSFDRVGEVPILKKELFFVDNLASRGNAVFGYQIAHYDYKFATNLMTGPFAPRAKNSIGKLYKYYEIWADPPSLNANFLVTSPSTIGDTLLLNHNQMEFGVFQFIAQFNFNVTAIRPMSFNPPPGLNRV